MSISAFTDVGIFSHTAMYASGAGLGASKGKDITKVAGLDYAALSKESVSNGWTVDISREGYSEETMERHLLTSLIVVCRRGNGTGGNNRGFVDSFLLGTRDICLQSYST